MKYDIYKYELKTMITELELPYGSQILKAGIQNERDIFLWIQVPTENRETVYRRFYLEPTGVEVDDKLKYVDTVFEDGGKLAWHIYEKIN